MKTALIPSYHSCIDDFNTQVGSHHTYMVKKTADKYEARVKEGWTNDMIHVAVYGAAKDDYLMGRHPQNQRRYLTPDYILRDDKLDYWFDIGMKIMKQDEEKKKAIERKAEELRKEASIPRVKRLPTWEEIQAKKRSKLSNPNSNENN